MKAGDSNASNAKCPPSGTLAGFIDGRLAADERVAVANHIADCGYCYETFASTVSMAEPQASPMPSRWFRALIAIAAAALIGIILSIVRVPDPLPEIVTAAEALRQRPIQGCLDGFPDAGWASVRGPNETTPPMRKLRRVAARIARSEGTDARTLHARGVAELLLGHKEDAIRYLTAATAAKNENAHYWSDLAAAYIELGESDGAALQDAVDAADQALTFDSNLPGAAFNRALALDKLGRRRDAIEAYGRYLRLDATSQVARDATRSRNRLQQGE
jgi:tetratricopeptide (TPR) repeat protein